MKDEIKFVFRGQKDMIAQLDYIAQYYGRSRNSEIIWAIREHIKHFQEENGKIDLPPKEDLFL